MSTMAISMTERQDMPRAGPGLIEAMALGQGCSVAFCLVISGPPPPPLRSSDQSGLIFPKEGCTVSVTVTAVPPNRVGMATYQGTLHGSLSRHAPTFPSGIHLRCNGIPPLVPVMMYLDRYRGRYGGQKLGPRNVYRNIL